MTWIQLVDEHRGVLEPPSCSAQALAARRLPSRTVVDPDKPFV
ncbi:hypothetical protein ACU686_07645 [Yinghuangia aomiensis]